jgi:hypothetical protein
MKTAVEWLLEQYVNKGIITIEDIEQANKMEKEQIINAHGNKLKKSKGVSNYEYWLSGEQYYNETFKTK